MDSLTRWTWVTPRFQAVVSDSINLRLIVGCLLTISKVILTYFILTYFAPEILNRIHILSLGGQGQRPGLVLALPVGDQFDTMTSFIHSLKNLYSAPSR